MADNFNPCTSLTSVEEIKVLNPTDYKSYKMTFASFSEENNGWFARCFCNNIMVRQGPYLKCARSGKACFFQIQSKLFNLLVSQHVDRAQQQKKDGSLTMDVAVCTKQTVKNGVQMPCNGCTILMNENPMWVNLFMVPKVVCNCKGYKDGMSANLEDLGANKQSFGNFTYFHLKSEEGVSKKQQQAKGGEPQSVVEQVQYFNFD